MVGRVIANLVLSRRTRSLSEVPVARLMQSRACRCVFGFTPSISKMVSPFLTGSREDCTLGPTHVTTGGNACRSILRANGSAFLGRMSVAITVIWSWLVEETARVSRSSEFSPLRAAVGSWWCSMRRPVAEDD